MKSKVESRQLRDLAKKLRHHLEHGILHFWLTHGPDQEAGGFLHHFNREGRLFSEDKYTVPTSRLIYAFSEAYKLLGRAEYLQAARDVFEFYNEKFWDGEHGGWYHAVNRRGDEAVEGFKRTYNFSFVIYAYAEYYGVSKDKRALEGLEMTVQILDERLHDAQNGGYLERFDRKWQRVLDDRKIMGTHMHLLEAFLSAAHFVDHALYMPRVLQLFSFHEEKMLHPKWPVYIETFDEAWRPIPQHGAAVVNYGHQVEIAFFLMDVAEITGRAEIMSRALGLLDHAMKAAWKPELAGMGCFGTPSGEIWDDRYPFWNQSEAMIALARAYRVTGETRYWQRLNDVVDVVFEWFVDPEFGEWYSCLRADGEVLVAEKGSAHKSCYHLVKALTYTIRELERASDTINDTGSAS